MIVTWGELATLTHPFAPALRTVFPAVIVTWLTDAPPGLPPPTKMVGEGLPADWPIVFLAMVTCVAESEIEIAWDE